MILNRYHLQMLVVETAALFLAGCVTFVVMWRRTLPESSRAEAFLTDVTKLEVGKSTFEDAKTLARKYGGIPWWVSDNSMQCTYQRCDFRFVFENKPLTSTHFVPYVGFIANVGVKNGAVTERHIHYARHSKRPFAYNVRETVLPDGDTPEAQAMRRLIGFRRMNVDKEGIPSAVSIDLEPSTSADERSRAYALNLSCLSKILGCSGPAAIFPSSIQYQGVPYQTQTETW